MKLCSKEQLHVFYFIVFVFKELCLMTFDLFALDVMLQFTALIIFLIASSFIRMKQTRVAFDLIFCNKSL